MIYIGIDPGQSGGLAALEEDGTLVEVAKMPTTERDILDWLAPFAAPVQAFAILERVGVMPKQGIVSAFTFGKGVGALRMALVASGIPFDETPPAKWQLAMGCRTGGDKNISKRRAQQLFPRTQVTHAIADALLIADYCRRITRGNLWKEARDGKEAEGGITGQGSIGPGEIIGLDVARRRPFEGFVPKGITRRRGGKTHGREVSAAEARTAVAGSSRHGAGPKRPAR